VLEGGLVADGRELVPVPLDVGAEEEGREEAGEELDGVEFEADELEAGALLPPEELGAPELDPPFKQLVSPPGLTVKGAVCAVWPCESRRVRPREVP